MMIKYYGNASLVKFLDRSVSLCFRRAHLRDCLELLKELVPSPPEHQKATTLALLQSAQQYIEVNIALHFFLSFYITAETLKL